MWKSGDELNLRWSHIQGSLFPWLREEVGELTLQHERIVLILDTLGLETHVAAPAGGRGRPPEDRRAIARAFVAKAVLNLPTTAALLDRLEVDARLRRICGWERRRQVPSEATFSRAFATFAAAGLPDTIHAALVRNGFADRLVGHVARDATAIEGREKPPPPAAKPPRRDQPGRPKKGEAAGRKRSDRLQRQPGLDLRAMLADLPTGCDVGAKRNGKGFRHAWVGYKLHLDVADADIPVAAILTSASLHDSQAAIPLIAMTSARVDYLYDIMDTAYAAAAIEDYSRRLGHRPIIVGGSDRHAPGRPPNSVPNANGCAASASRPSRRASPPAAAPPNASPAASRRSSAPPPSASAATPRSSATSASASSRSPPKTCCASPNQPQTQPDQANQNAPQEVNTQFCKRLVG